MGQKRVTVLFSDGLVIVVRHRVNRTYMSYKYRDPSDCWSYRGHSPSRDSGGRRDVPSWSSHSGRSQSPPHHDQPRCGELGSKPRRHGSSVLLPPPSADPSPP